MIGTLTRGNFTWKVDPLPATLSTETLPPEALKATIQAFADIGVDELICWPCIAELEQVDRLADIASAQ